MRLRYDHIIILLISLLIFGYYGSPLYPSRLLALAVSPIVLKELNKKSLYIPQYVRDFFIVWIVVGVVSILWSWDKDNGFKSIFYHFCNIVSFFSLYVFGLKSKNPIRSILIGWILLFALTLPIAFYEFVTDSHLSISFQDEDLGMIGTDGVRMQRHFASVTYGNLNKYNTILCYIMPFLLSSFLFFRNKKEHMILGLLLLLMFYVVVMNASRGALLCFSLSVAFSIYYLVKNNILNRFIVFIMLLFMVVIVMINIETFLGQIIARLADSGTSDDSRLTIYSRGLNSLISTSGFGVGMGGILEALRTSSSEAAPHNMYLEFLVQFGIVPFFFLLRFMAMLYNHLRKSRIQVLKVLGTVLIVIAIPLFIINSNYLMDTDMWLFWGSAFAILLYSKNNKDFCDENKRC